MRPSKLLLIAFAFFSVSAPTAYGRTDDSVEPHFLRWAIVWHGNVSNYDTDVLDGLDRAKRKYGDDFLYIRQDDRGYVIREHSMVERAQHALDAMKSARRDIGDAPRTKKERKAPGKRLKHEIHEIFEDAKARHLAERVE